ncbi:MAG: hypothetical protein ACLTDR_11815 [Adlercreutzia equolifaciens]
MATAIDVLRIARAEVGYRRYDDPSAAPSTGGGMSRKWTAQAATTTAPTASPTAPCSPPALAQAGVECAGMPGSYRPSIHHSQTLAASQLQPGDLVLFDWDNDNTDDHIGIVA